MQAANLWTLEPTTEETIKELVPDSMLDYIDGLVDAKDTEDE